MASSVQFSVSAPSDCPLLYLVDVDTPTVKQLRDRVLSSPHPVPQCKILVLGGSGFVGLGLVHWLGAFFLSLETASKKSIEWKIVVINRQRKRWGSSKPFGPTLNSRIVFVKGNRDKPEKWKLALHDACRQLQTSQSQPQKWDFVVDFSAYTVEDMAVTTQVLTRNNVAHYIFISSDSVYEVCDPGTSSPRREADCHRPSDPAERKRLAKYDDYGDGKLAIEELLASQHKSGSGFDWTALRYTDVYGPYDNTDRVYLYILWILISDARPIDLLKKHRKRRMGLVYRDSAVRAILRSWLTGQPAFGQAFNIAEKESPYLTEFLKGFASVIGVQSLCTRAYPPSLKSPHPQIIYLTDNNNSHNRQNHNEIQNYKKDNESQNRNRNESTFVTAADFDPTDSDSNCSDSDSNCSDSDSNCSDSSVDSHASFLPSVDFGPVDLSKAQTTLDFEPVGLANTFQPTAEFFLRTAWHTLKERPDLTEDFVSEHRRLIKKKANEWAFSHTKKHQ